MDPNLKPSELILNANGSIYHLGLKKENVARTILTVGDPQRAALIATYFDHIDFEHQTREFYTLTGRLHDIPLTVISTGIGTDNIDIVFNELDALFNIDLDNRTIKKEKTQLTFIRVGTTGALLEKTPLGSILQTKQSIGLDALGRYYLKGTDTNTFAELQLEQGSSVHGYQLSSELNTLPFALPSVTYTMPGFYAPQARSLRLKSQLNTTDLVRHFEDLEQPNWHANIEMETSGIFLLSHLMGHKAYSFSVALANRTNGQFAAEPAVKIKEMIEIILEKENLLTMIT